MVLCPSTPLQKFFLLQAVHMILKCPWNNFFWMTPYVTETTKKMPFSDFTAICKWCMEKTKTKVNPFSGRMWCAGVWASFDIHQRRVGDVMPSRTIPLHVFFLVYLCFVSSRVYVFACVYPYVRGYDVCTCGSWVVFFPQILFHLSGFERNTVYIVCSFYGKGMTNVFQKPWYDNVMNDSCWCVNLYFPAER